MKKKLGIFLLIVFILGLSTFIFTYKVYFSNNITLKNDAEKYTLYIPTNSTYEDVICILNKSTVIKNIGTFKSVAKRLSYDKSVKPGRYVIHKNTGNFFLVRKLRAGAQDPVNITFNNIQNKEQLAKKISDQIEASESSLLKEFNNPHFIDSLNLTEDNFSTIFLANTYEFYWNTSAKQFIARMLKEYNKFWNENRKEKAQAIGLSPTDVTILASIVQKESTKYDEYPTIAGVYLNRLKIGMPLQADPTVLFALKKLGVNRRVLKADLKIQSPYNTYLNKGLPPGPICLPELKSIDETLDADEHNYIYFCAKEDFSGYSNFAETWQEHLENANKYQKALDERNIKR